MENGLLMALFLVTTICYILLLLRAVQLLTKYTDPLSDFLKMPLFLKALGWILVLTGTCIGSYYGFLSASSGPDDEPLLPIYHAGIIFLPPGLIILYIGSWLIQGQAKLFLSCLLLIGFSFISGVGYTIYRINWQKYQEYWPDTIGLATYYFLLFTIGPSLLWIRYNKKNQ